MRRCPLVFLSCLLLVQAPTAHGAEQSADGVIAYRQNVMRALGGHMGAMALILKGEVGAAKDLRVHADSVIGLAGLVPSLFPVGSDSGRTNALPEIWLEPARFQQRVSELRRAVDGFRRGVGGSRREFARGFQGLAAACKDCHDGYKSE
jgi:cytochrome c556